MNSGHAPAPSAYGAAIPFTEVPAGFTGVPMKATFGNRNVRRVDCPTVCAALLVPWAIFIFTYMVLSFRVHYDLPLLAWGLCLVALAITLWFGYNLVRILWQRSSGDDSNDPTWWAFFFWTSLIAWMVAVCCGHANFVHNMRPYYDVANLNFYPSVDPSQFRGQQMMDAGQISFVDGTHLDLTRSMGFRNQQTYCVAPIVTGSEVLDTYDFWAVGLDCCSGGSADFHCGEFNNQNAQAGLRLMDDDARAFFRLAVQQAEAAYSLEARHPLFFYWMSSPLHELQAYSDDGYRFFLLGVFTFFAFQLFVLIVSIIILSRFGSLYAPFSAVGSYI